MGVVDHHPAARVDVRLTNGDLLGGLRQIPGMYYEAASVEVRGYPVDFANSVHGLHALVADTTLLATPRADGAALERHSAGTEVDIIGTAEAADYYYVSPCNACASGFVPRTALPPLLRQ